MEFNYEYLKRFLQEETLLKKDLMDFYMCEGIKEKYTLIENDINNYSIFRIMYDVIKYYFYDIE